MKLKVMGRYNSPRGRWKPGEEIDVSRETATYLMADAPGCFEEIIEGELSEEEIKAFEEPPADKMVRSPKKKK